MSDSAELRASDSERENAVRQLSDAAAAGRIDPEELAERVQAADGARTRAEIDQLLADLPPVPSVGLASPDAAVPAATPGRQVARSERFRRRLAGFLIPNFVCLAVWAATGAGSFWPGWVLLGTGIGFGSYAIRALLGVDDKHERDRSERNARRIERRAGR